MRELSLNLKQSGWPSGQYELYAYGPISAPVGEWKAHLLTPDDIWSIIDQNAPKRAEGEWMGYVLCFVAGVVVGALYEKVIKDKAIRLKKAAQAAGTELKG